MPLRRPILSLVSLFSLVACGPAPQALTPEPAPPATVPAPEVQVAAATPAEAPVEDPSADFDPLQTGLSVDGVKRLCADHLANATAIVDRIKALKDAPAEQLSYSATLGRFDDVLLELNRAGELPYLLAVAHPDTAVREAAKLCEPKTDAFSTSLYLDADLAAVLRAYAQKNEPLAGEKKKLLSDVLRDFRRGGLELPADKQAELRKLSEELTRLGQDFSTNISTSTGSIEVPKASLDGLPPEYVASHKPGKGGKVTITVDYPDYFPFVTYSKDRKSALELYVKFVNRGGDENVKVLERILELRSKKAKMLGYASWADYAVEPRMAKTAKAVRDFLAEVREAVKEPANAEMAEFMAEHVRLGGRKTDKLYPPDRYYLEDRVRARKYKLDSVALSKYFEIGAVKKGIFDITAEMYGLEYKQVATTTWHPDVEVYEVWSKGADGAKALLGKVYLDLYSRPNKFKHMAMFPLRTAKRLRSGAYVTPMAALECNFPKPGAEPALLRHEDVVTFFHEFGHVLHQILTRSELAAYSGTSAARDFVEAPSQLFEEWAYAREVLERFARHHETGEKIPDGLFEAMQKARSFGRALSTQRQLVFATLDFEYHAREPGFDTTKLADEVQAQNDSFTPVKGTHWQSSFGHLIGYDAGYYGYQWSLALARDALTRFLREGLLNTKTAAAWRDEVLAKGGGADEREMLTRFLGRAPNNEAYSNYLKGKE